MWLVGCFHPFRNFQVFTTVIDEDTGVNGAVSGSRLMQNIGIIEIKIHNAVRRKVLEIKSNKKVAGKKEHPMLQIPEVLAKGKVLHQVGWVSSRFTVSFNGINWASFGEEFEIERLVNKSRAKAESQSKYTYEYDTKEMLAKFTFRYRPLGKHWDQPKGDSCFLN